MTPPRPGDRFGLYLHIPVCLSKCPYCDFVSYERDLLGFGQIDRIVAALHSELNLALQAHSPLRGRPLDSVYFGGGTPSLLPAEAVAGLIEATHAAFTPREPVEITLECNPASAEVERLAAYRKAGVNRISLGVQSFQPCVLRALGRRHSASEAREAVARLQSLNFSSWGFDLIFGAPGSSLALWEADLREAVRIRPPHLSVYGMTLHEGTPLFERRASGELRLPDEETQREMFLMARRALTSAGWAHYEISNYALPAQESRHNSLYWSNAEYLGLGVAAHSYTGGRRWANPADLREYLRNTETGSLPAVVEPLPSPRSLRAERIMLALRLLEGFDPRELSNESGFDFLQDYVGEIRDLAQKGWLLASPTNVRLTEEGILMSDQVFEAFF